MVHGTVSYSSGPHVSHSAQSASLVAVELASKYSPATHSRTSVHLHRERGGEGVCV